MKRSAILPAVAGALLGSLAFASSAFAHQTYNVGTLNDPPPPGTGNTWVYSVSNGWGNGVDGAINDSQHTGTAIPNANLVWRSGVGAVSPEYSGNLPEMWYSGLHNTATGASTRREIGTVSDPGGMPGGTGASGGTTFYTAGSSLGARIATWNNLQTTQNAGIQLDPNSQIAVKGNSWLSGDGLDYGVTHATCGTAEGCLVDGDMKINWTLKNLNALSTSILGIAVYGGFDTSSSSDRNALFNGSVNLVNPQSSSLGAPIWSAVMTDPGDVLSYTRRFDAAEAALYHGEYTVIIGALNDTGDGQYYLRNTFSAVPIPATLWLFGIGLASLRAVSRHKEGQIV